MILAFKAFPVKGVIFSAGASGLAFGLLLTDADFFAGAAVLAIFLVYQNISSVRLYLMVELLALEIQFITKIAVVHTN